jgi:hypothetical protein
MKIDAKLKSRMFGGNYCLGFSIDKFEWEEENEIVSQNCFTTYFMLLSFSFRSPMIRDKKPEIELIQIEELADFSEILDIIVEPLPEIEMPSKRPRKPRKKAVKTTSKTARRPRKKE